MSLLHYFRTRHPYTWKTFHVSHVRTRSLVHSSSPVPSRHWVPPPPSHASREGDPVLRGALLHSQFGAELSLSPPSRASCRVLQMMLGWRRSRRSWKQLEISGAVLQAGLCRCPLGLGRLTHRRDPPLQVRLPCFRLATVPAGNNHLFPAT